MDTNFLLIYLHLSLLPDSPSHFSVPGFAHAVPSFWNTAHWFIPIVCSATYVHMYPILLELSPMASLPRNLLIGLIFLFLEYI